MSRTVDLLMEISGVTKIVLTQKRDYEYDYHQTLLLNEIASLYKKLSKDEKLTYSSLVADTGCAKYLREGFEEYKEKSSPSYTNHCIQIA